MNLVQAEIIAERLMHQHGLTAKGWKFEWDNAWRRSGCCHFLKRTITLSRAITEVNPRTHLIDTLLHEIAHALVGVGHHHDREWKRIARRIGCVATRCSTEQTHMPTPRWMTECPECGHTILSDRQFPAQCVRCHSERFDKQYLLRWKRTPKEYKPRTTQPQDIHGQIPLGFASPWARTAGVAANGSIRSRDFEQVAESKEG